MKKEEIKKLFFDIESIWPELRKNNIIIGGRGIGKTYSTLKKLVDLNEPFLYLRNTDVQLKECCGDFGNPFKTLNRDFGLDIHIRQEKTHGVIYSKIDDSTEEIIGYAAALSTFENLRGVDLSDIKYCVFDEFIEKRKLSFDQYDAYYKFYETVNRNRELFGEEPFKVILLSNSQSLNNPILAGFNYVAPIEGMLISGQKKHKMKDTLILLPDSKISELKKNTGIHTIAKGSKVYNEAIKNEFANDSRYGICKRNLREYTGLVMVDDLYIYKHKSMNRYYVCTSQCTNLPEFKSEENKILFYKGYGKYLQLAYAAGNLEFSDFVTKTKILSILT